jgi:hypothetical protein
MLCELQIVAIILSIALIMLTVILAPSIHKSFHENAKLEKPRDFHIVFGQTIHWTPRVRRIINADIFVDLVVHYPHGTLVVNDPVEISARAILNSPERQDMQSISAITLTFENAQLYPIVWDDEKISDEIHISLKQTQEKNIWTGNATIAWTLEGSYHPLISYTSDQPRPCGPIPNTAITVYPKSQIAQIVTNKAFLYVAIATYLVGAASVLNIIFQLWYGTI